MKLDDVTFEDYLSFFPEIEFPILLTEESAKEFSLYNKALPGIMVFKYITKGEEELDDLTEVVPCFKLKDTPGMHALVYWKAGLLNYEYVLTTFDLEGNFIDGKVIGGLVSNGDTIIRTVATLDEDWTIHVVVGQEKSGQIDLNTESQAFTMELLATGEIIFSLNKE